MILQSQVCEFSKFLAYHFLNKLSCAIQMNLQSLSLLILVTFLKSSHLSLVPFVLVVMNLIVCVLKFMIIPQDKIGLCAMLSSKDLFGIFYDFFSGYHTYYLSGSLVCTWFFVGKYLSDFIHLEIYTHERIYILV